jgi:hypothetical protein
LATFQTFGKWCLPPMIFWFLILFLFWFHETNGFENVV